MDDQHAGYLQALRQLIGQSASTGHPTADEYEWRVITAGRLTRVETPAMRAMLMRARGDELPTLDVCGFQSSI